MKRINWLNGICPLHKIGHPSARCLQCEHCVKIYHKKESVDCRADEPPIKKIKFKMSRGDSARVSKWNTDHKKDCPYVKKPTAIGGRLTYSFTPTGLGTITVVKCACGEKLDLTDSDHW